MKDILVRSATGAIFISIVIGSLVYSAWSALLVMGVFAAIGLWEYQRMLQTEQGGPHPFFTLLSGLVIYGLLGYNWLVSSTPLSLVFVGIFPIILMFLELYRNQSQPLQNVALTFFSWMYIIAPLFILVYMRGDEGMAGSLYPIGMLLIVWTNDTFAYLFGRFLGKNKLFPRISPKKTWEGTLGGVLFALIAGALIAYFSNQSYLLWLVASLVIAPAAIFGDLFESMIKRSLGIKDTGAIMPGHGGILDRFDAVFFAAPLFGMWLLIYFYMYF
jgi:phosphatidate cytidylyltransferase